MTKAFVSYSRKDTDFTRTLTEALIAQQMEIWIDWKNIPPTVDWKLQIQKGVEEADTFIFLISPDSIKSGECAEEIMHAVKNGKRLIPILVRDINAEDLPKDLKHINWIVFNKKDSFEEAFQKLLEAINTDYDWVQTHSRLQVKALDWERQNKENSFLLRGKDLEAAEGQLVVNASKEPKPTELQREFVLKSKKAKAAQQRITTAVSIGAAVIMLILSVWAIINANEANNQRIEAESQRNEANKQKSIAQANEEKAQDTATFAQIGEYSALAVGRIDQDYNEALLYSVEAYRRAENTGFNQGSAKSALLTTLQSRHGLLQILPGHTDWITSLVYSQDGKTIASSGWDDITYLWNAADPANPIDPIKMDGHDVAISTDNRIAATAYFDENSTSQVALWDISDRSKPAKLGMLNGQYIVDFSPNNNFIVVVNTDEENNSIIQIWDISNLIAPTLIQSLAGTNAYLSPEGTYLAITSQDENFNNILSLWNIKNPDAPISLSTLSGNFSADRTYQQSLVFSSDESILAVAGYDAAYNSIVKLWGISNPYAPEELSTLSGGGSDYISSLAINSDSTYLALGSNDGKIFLWNIGDPAAPSSSPSSDNFTGHALLVSQLAFNPDGKSLITGGYDGRIMVWDTGLYNPIQVTAPTGSLLASSSNGKMLATQYFNPITQSDITPLWDVSEPSKPVQIGELTGYSASAMFSPDGKLIVTFRYDPTSEVYAAVLWDISNPAFPVDHQFMENISSPYNYQLTFSPKGNVLVMSTYDEETTTLWDISKPDVPVQFGLIEQYVDKINFSPDSNILAIDTYIDEPEITFWDITQSGQYAKLGKMQGYGIAFSTDNQTIALMYDQVDSTIVQLWNISDWSKRTQINTVEGTTPLFSPNGKVLITRIANNENESAQNLLVWDIANPLEPTSHTLIGHTKAVTSVAISPDNKIMASASSDKTIIIWDISSPAQPAKITTLNGHSDWVMYVAFSPDGATLASGSFDGGVVLWDVHDPKNIRQIGKLNGHTSVINNIQFPADGKTLITSAGSSTILWDINPLSWTIKACNIAGSNFTEEKWNQLFPSDDYRSTCENVGIASAPSTEPLEPVAGGDTTVPLCTDTQGASSCALLSLEERDRFCVETVSYTLYAMPEGTTITPLEEGFNCTNEGVRSGNQIYTCYSLEHPNMNFQANMCNTGCAVSQSTQCTTGFGLDLSQSCCTPLSSEGCVEVTLEVGVCAQ